MQLKGRLEYTSLFRPIKLFTETGQLDLWEYYKNLFSNLNGQKVSMAYTLNSIETKSDDNSELILSYQNDKGGIGILISNTSSGTNVAAYLADMFQRLNARHVIVEIDDTAIKIQSDESEQVYGLRYTNNNNCIIPDDKVHSLCKPATTDACIFFSVSGTGCECMKFNSTFARMVLDRHEKGTLNATRIGNCALLGRAKEKVEEK